MKELAGKRRWCASTCWPHIAPCQHKSACFNVSLFRESLRNIRSQHVPCRMPQLYRGTRLEIQASTKAHAIATVCQHSQVAIFQLPWSVWRFMARLGLQSFQQFSTACKSICLVATLGMNLVENCLYAPTCVGDQS